MDWFNIWNNRCFNKNNTFEYNGYQFKTSKEYSKFINELTKNINIKENSNILDIGCGNGSFSNIFIKNKKINNYSLFGLDYCKKSIEYARQNFEGNFINHDISKNLPFKNGMFDVILCVSTLFYLKNNQELENILNEIIRVAKNKCLIFLGNCMDENKKDLSEKIRKNTHIKISKHLYINKNYLLNFFKKSNIQIIDNKDLDIPFYIGQDYKFSALIEYNKTNNIGIDFHDTISANPNYYRKILADWNGKRIIITGTPLSKKNEILKSLNDIGFYKKIHYDEIEFGYEYKKDSMDFSHFNKMKEHKLKIIKKHNIKIYYDDNPFYVDFIRNKCELVLQPILSNEYINKFKKIDKYFCCNLQEKQFNYLKNFDTKKKIYFPGTFDLFHLGHLNIIKNAKNICDSYLIIGVQDDTSVYNSKKKYPIIKIFERINFIKELEIADRVISYSNINQSELLKKMKIDIFVIGPEFGNCIEHQNTLEFCKNNNIKVVVIERTKNISTSEIIKRIQK